MDRRTVLATAGFSLTSLVAGCSQAADDTDNAAPHGTATGNGAGDTTATGTDSPEQTADESDDGAVPGFVELEPVNYVVRSYQVPVGRGIDPDDIVPQDAIPRALRVPLQAARDGRFESDSVSDELLAAIDEFRKYDRTAFAPYVRLDGTAYEFEPSVPTFVARLAEEEADDYDTERVVQDDAHGFESEAVRSFVSALRANGTEVPRADYRTSLVPEPVEAFLDEYEYVEDQFGVARIVTERVATDPPYTIEVRELTDEDLWGRPVVEEAALDVAVREFFVTAIGSDHRAPATMSPRHSQYFTDDVPDAYNETYDDAETYPYFRVDGTVYSVDVLSPRYDEIPVAVSVTELAPATGDGNGRFELTVTPSTDDTEVEVAGDTSFVVRSRGALPSVLWLSTNGDRYLLESDAYDRDTWRAIPDDPEFDRRPVNEELEVIDITGEIATTYRIPADVPDGTYVSRGYFFVSWEAPGQVKKDRAFYPFRLRVTVGGT